MFSKHSFSYMGADIAKISLSFFNLPGMESALPNSCSPTSDDLSPPLSHHLRQANMPGTKLMTCIWKATARQAVALRRRKLSFHIYNGISAFPQEVSIQEAHAKTYCMIAKFAIWR